MTVLIGLTLALTAAASDPFIDGPPMEWLETHSPYGMDITPDGKVWINTNRTGSRDDYAILANDLHRVVEKPTPYPKVWIRGYHLRNSAVSYRQTKQLISIDCRSDRIGTVTRVYYAPSGDVIQTDGQSSFDAIVPGSLGEVWRKATCPAAR